MLQKIIDIALNGKQHVFLPTEELGKVTLRDLDVDSLSLLQFICQLEEQFQIKIPDEDLSVENFYDLESILRIVTKHL